MTIKPQKCIDGLANKAFDRRGKCKWCGSDAVIKNGRKDGQQLYKCKECSHQFFDNNKPPRMRTPEHVIACGLQMYFDGMSLPTVSRNLKKFFGIKVSYQKIHKWIMKYVPIVSEYLSTFKPELSGNWHADETVLKFRGIDHWHWDAIDEGTRFIVGNHISATRALQDGKAFFGKCRFNKPRPQRITTDGMQAYHRAINSRFYSRYKDRKVEHISLKSVSENMLIERWHGTLKDRTKPMRGLKTPMSEIPNGFVIHYNFLRPHTSLKGMTPAEKAQINLPFEDGWGDLISWATIWQTLHEKGQPT